MARTVSLLLSAQHSADLQGVIEDRGRPVKHVQRAQIILLSAERLPVLKIAKRVGVSRPMVWRNMAAASSPRKALRLVARQDPPARHPASGVFTITGACRGRAHPARTARCSHPLDRPRHGRGDESFAANDPAHMGRHHKLHKAAPDQDLQAIQQRSRLRRWQA